MRQEHVQYLRCPYCRFEFHASAEKTVDDRIETGVLRCFSCGSSFPITRFVPRFVSSENYAASFGLEWNAHSRTQYDATTGRALSERRFYDETGWPRDMSGELIIEVGSGSGRFTEQALASGATVLSLEYSDAVEANYASNGAHDNLLLVQGDLYWMPFVSDVADRLFCIGVLQHTPTPRDSLASLRGFVKPGGEIVADIYELSFTKSVLRPQVSGPADNAADAP